MKPRDELGKILRKHLHCPACSGQDGMAGMMAALRGGGDEVKPLRVVAYRKTSVRLGCRNCGLRFSIDISNFADVVAERERPSVREVERHARELTKDHPGEYLVCLVLCREKADEVVRDQRNEILRHHQAGLAADSPRRGRINFPERARKRAA